MLASMWEKNNYMYFHRPHSTPLVDELTICSPKDGIHTLVDVIIIDPTQANLLPSFYEAQRFVAFDAAEAKHPTNKFLPLAIKVFGCLHKQADMFLHDYANAIWSLKGPKGPHLFVLVIFLY
jgi:hypothetical protein